MNPEDVERIMKNASMSDPRLERLVQKALARIPLRYENISPLRIFLSGYRDAVSASIEPTGDTWFNIIIMDEHDLENRDDDYVQGVVAHEIAHIYLGHPRVRDIEARSRQEEEAKRLAASWGF